MEFIEIFNRAPITAILSNDGITATDQAIKTLNNIKNAAKAKNVFITYWHNGKVTFTSIYSHTAKVPAKALKDLAAFETWNIERINHYFTADSIKCRIK